MIRIKWEREYSQYRLSMLGCDMCIKFNSRARRSIYFSDCLAICGYTGGGDWFECRATQVRVNAFNTLKNHVWYLGELGSSLRSEASVSRIIRGSVFA